MSTTRVLGFLILAALLEAGGDFLIRCGLDSKSPIYSYFFIVLGGIILWAYGYKVNSVPWDFGRLLGTYVVIFFLVTQFIGYISNRKKLPAGLEFLFTLELPAGLILAGSLLIIMGGILFALGQHLTPTISQSK